ncbi:hypothetical protein [Methylacidimicrobium sp. AP8]|uniref:FitA-like ribbon-helix-helix domain-containing protein n=1 Tax=Methylacidimicrobium sp. AP8 TaxID=2730359 RepID=UPI001F3817EC|nr:hypothetical protein [Methylacidimicrobium sp. AP8]
MPGNLHVRNPDEELIARLKRRAARHGRSAEAEHREILRQALRSEEEPPSDKPAAELRQLTNALCASCAKGCQQLKNIWTHSKFNGSMSE